MSSQEVLTRVIDDLGYRDGRGYVDADAGEGPRDVVWHDLRDKCGMTSAFFKGAVPVVAFFAADTHDDALRAHRRLWNYGRVPLLIAATDTEVLVLSCNTAPSDSQPNAALLERAAPGFEASRVLADFTRFGVESGKLHRSRGRQLSKQDRVDQSLLRNLQVLRERLLDGGVLESEIEPLLGRTIFVRYLEDRGILGPNELLSLGQPPSLEDALAIGWEGFTAFFAAMSEHFSGDVFRPDALERPIPRQALIDLSRFFHGDNLTTGQAALWPYDFSIIPAEFISSIYEQLLADQQKADAAFYTPRHVVDLVLDELIPPGEHSEEGVTVLDPACGSGIFLTEAFRRLVDRKTRALGGPLGYEQLKALLVSSVFGVDRNRDAIGVAAFGLYLALLEHVDPRTIWLQARLPRLVGENLVAADYFDDHALSNHEFDVIAGNPPWQSKLSEAALQYAARSEHAVPDRQIAAAFVWRVAEMLRPGGVAGLVLPAKTILHNQSASAERFRAEFFAQLDVQTIIDLSPLRHGLFGVAISPAAITIFGPSRVEAEGDVLHVSPRRTPISEIVDGIAIPQQNIQRVASATIRSNPRLWKTLLWGGAEDVALVSLLRESSYSLFSHAKERGWVVGTGYQESGGDQNDASHLHDISRIRTRDIRAMVPPTELLPPSSAQTMHRPRDRAIFLGPHILLRNGVTNSTVAAYAPYDAAFTDGVFAIAGDAKDEQLLQAVAALLNSSVAQYWYFMTASSWGVERDKVELQEWLTLPLPRLEPRVLADLASITSAAATAKAEHEWRPALDRVAARAYGLTTAEQQVVADALDVRFSEYQQGSLSHAYLAPDQVQFESYTRALKARMDKLQPHSWTVEVSERREDFARVTCVYDDLEKGAPAALIEPSDFTVASLLKTDSSMLNDALSSATMVEPQAIVLDGVRIHIVKPNRLSCWMASSSARDAADVFGALVGARA